MYGRRLQEAVPSTENPQSGSRVKMFDEVCPFCESDAPFELHGVVVESREIDGVFCCEGYRDAMGMILDGLDEEEWAGFWKAYFGKPEVAGGIRAAYGLEVRSVINEPTCAPFTLDFK